MSDNQKLYHFKSGTSKGLIVFDTESTGASFFFLGTTLYEWSDWTTSKDKYTKFNLVGSRCLFRW